MGRDHPVLGCDVAATALDGLAERVTRLERVVEQIAGAPVPQIWEPIEACKIVRPSRLR